jgi:large subunit ribosomal protein L2
LYRQIDFRWDKEHITRKIVTIEYDLNKSAYIYKVHYKNGNKMYIMHPIRVMIGDTIFSGPKVPISIGNALPLSAV